MSTRAPGEAVPVIVTEVRVHRRLRDRGLRRHRAAGLGHRRGQRQRRLALACGPRTGRPRSTAAPAAGPRPGPGSAAPPGRWPRSAGPPIQPAWPSVKPIDAVVGSLPYGEAGRSGCSHTCSGTRPTPDAELSMKPSCPAAPVAPVRSPTVRSCSARSPDSTGHGCPVPVSVVAHGLAGAVGVAVPVAVVPVETGAAGSAGRDGGVHDLERVGDQRQVLRQLTQPGQVQEPGVDHAALVQGRAAVAQAVGDGRVGVAGLGQPDEVRVRRNPGRWW